MLLIAPLNKMEPSPLRLQKRIITQIISAWLETAEEDLLRSRTPRLSVACHVALFLKTRRSFCTISRVTVAKVARVCNVSSVAHALHQVPPLLVIASSAIEYEMETEMSSARIRAMTLWREQSLQGHPLWQRKGTASLAAKCVDVTLAKLLTLAHISALMAWLSSTLTKQRSQPENKKVVNKTDNAE